MGAKGNNLSAKGGAVSGKTAPLFDDRAEEEARPVVPLGPDTAPVASAGKTRPARGGLPRNLTLALLIAAAGAAGAAGSYLSFRQEAPEPSAEASAGGATNPTPPQPEPQTSPRQARGEASGTLSGATGETGRRNTPPMMGDPNGREPEEAEARWRGEKYRDREKHAERAAKEEERRREAEKKIAERRREEAKKLEERRRDTEKQGRPEARLIGVISGKPRP